MSTEMTRAEKAAIANKLIGIVAAHGRRFFRHGENISRLEVDKRGRVWFFDKYTSRRIYTHNRYRWRGFTEGGTLQDFVCALRDWIMGRDAFPIHALGPWPDWYCGGDLWGYGEAMKTVRSEALDLVKRHNISDIKRAAWPRGHHGGSKQCQS